MKGQETVTMCIDKRKVYGGGNYGGAEFNLNGTVINHMFDADIEFNDENKRDIKLKCKLDKESPNCVGRWEDKRVGGELTMKCGDSLEW